jgi:hypothetical protein
LDILSTLVMWFTWVCEFYHQLVKLVYLLECHTPCGMNYGGFSIEVYLECHTLCGMNFGGLGIEVEDILKY